MNKKGKIALAAIVMLLLTGTAVFAQSRGGDAVRCGPGRSSGCGGFGGGYEGERDGGNNGNGGSGNGGGGFGCH